MTEYTSSPAAIEQYRSTRARTVDWVSRHRNDSNSFVSPSIPPSLIDDSDDGMSTPSESDFSSHSLPPRMKLKYPDGRPDIPISESDDTPASGRGRRKEVEGWTTTSPYVATPAVPHQSSNPSRHISTGSRTVTHPHSSLPPIGSQPSSTVLMVPPPHQNFHHPAPETIQIHPSHASPYNPYNPVDPQGSSSQRSRSMHSSRSKHSATHYPPPQMIYTPPNPPPNFSIPASPTQSHFSQYQKPREILSPSPVYGYSNKPELTEAERVEEPDLKATPTPAPADIPRGRASRSGSHSNSYAPAPITSHYSHTLSKSSSGSGRGHKPPSIVYAPSKHSSDSYNYNPPVILNHPPHAAVPMERTASQHPSSHYLQPSQHSSHHTTRSHHSYSQSRSQPPPAQRVAASQPIVPSYSDPTHDRGRSGLNSSKYYQTYNNARPSSSQQVYRRAPTPEENTRGGGGYTYDDRRRDSHSSGSTYYVIPAEGQKVTVVSTNPAARIYSSPSRNHTYADNSNMHHSRYYSHPRSATVAPIAPSPGPEPEGLTTKRPLLQRILRRPHQGNGRSTPEPTSAKSSSGGFGHGLGSLGMAPAKLRRRLTERGDR